MWYVARAPYRQKRGLSIRCNHPCPLHWDSTTPNNHARDYGGDIPREILTLENLLKKDQEGATVFHDAAIGGHLQQIPKEYLTEENLLKSDKHGESALDLAIAKGNMDQMLGVEFSEKTLLKYKDTIPYGWFESNREICAERKRLKAQLTQEVEETNIELF